jgi:hypothetical protein
MGEGDEGIAINNIKIGVRTVGVTKGCGVDPAVNAWS